jgi:hypothetical protein
MLLRYWQLLLARRLLSCAPALEKMLLSVFVSDLICAGGTMKEKGTAAKEWTLKECLKKTWYQTDIKTQDDLEASKQTETKGYRCVETMTCLGSCRRRDFLLYMTSTNERLHDRRPARAERQVSLVGCYEVGLQVVDGAVKWQRNAFAPGLDHTGR